jgi:hypothetical protein
MYANVAYLDSSAAEIAKLRLWILSPEIYNVEISPQQEPANLWPIMQYAVEQNIAANKQSLYVKEERWLLGRSASSYSDISFA